MVECNRESSWVEDGVIRRSNQPLHHTLVTRVCVCVCVSQPPKSPHANQPNPNYFEFLPKKERKHLETHQINSFNRTRQAKSFTFDRFQTRIPTCATLNKPIFSVITLMHVLKKSTIVNFDLNPWSFLDTWPDALFDVRMSNTRSNDESDKFCIWFTFHLQRSSNQDTFASDTLSLQVHLQLSRHACFGSSWSVFTLIGFRKMPWVLLLPLQINNCPSFGKKVLNPWPIVHRMPSIFATFFDCRLLNLLILCWFVLRFWTSSFSSHSLVVCSIYIL